MRTNLLLCLFVFICQGPVFSQHETDISLFLKKDKRQITEVESESGNLFRKLGHHGPAVENPWLAFRLYFDKKAAIDIYSKAKPGMEIKEKKWYPSKKEQRSGWGADYYKVGKSLGLGGIRLWDGEKVVPLHPVSKRSAKVVKGSESSYMEMLSEGVPYRGKKVDILVRVTVYPDKRNARVEAECTNGTSVQFVTGINYFKNFKVQQSENHIATWGIHPEDVAAEKVELGAAIFFDQAMVEKELDDGKQHLLISKPSTTLSTEITSINAREPEVDNYQQFIEWLNKQ